MIGLLEIIVLAGTVLAALSWLLVVLLVPFAFTSRAPRSWAKRLWVARIWLFAPIWFPLVILVASILPKFVGAVTRYGDHCLTHANHHHLCFLHPPHIAGNVVTWLLPLGLVVPTGLVMMLWARRCWIEWRLTRALVGMSRPSDLGSDVRVLEQDAPLAMTVGWRKTTILLSRGLLLGIGPQVREVVLAHERAHISRRDLWFAPWDRFAATLLPRRVANVLIEEITLAREQSCDFIAAQQVGGPIVVAQALAEVFRLGMKVPAVGASIASGAVEARVAHLLYPPKQGKGWVLVLGGFLVALVVAGASPGHTSIETMIASLLH